MIINWLDHSTKQLVWLDEIETYKIINSFIDIATWDITTDELLNVVATNSRFIKYSPEIISETGSGTYYCDKLEPVSEQYKNRFPPFLAPALRSALFKLRVLDGPGPEPEVTVMITTYNREESCARAVESVLGQTYPNIRCLVVRDGPGKYNNLPDDPRLEFYSLPRRGRYPDQHEKRWHVAGRDPANYAVALTRGPILCLLDDDDIFLPDHVETIVNAWKESKAHLIYTEPHTSDGRKPFDFDFNRDKLNKENFIFTCNTAYCGAALLYVNIPPRYADTPGDWAVLRRISEAGLIFRKIKKITTIHGDEELTRKRKEYIRRLIEQQGVKSTPNV